MNELKILVVDDESRMRKLVKDFLTRAGYQVLEAQDGEEAVDTFYSTKGINLLVLDVMMSPNIHDNSASFYLFTFCLNRSS